MKKTDLIFLITLFAVALACMIRFVPDKAQAYADFLADGVKIGVHSSQLLFVENHLSLKNLVKNEMNNPLKNIEDISASETDITATDSDIKALKARAEKRYQSGGTAGNIVERTFVDMNSQVQYGNVKVQNRTLKKINIKKILAEGANLKIADKSKPTVLIYHTHTHESYVMLEKGRYMKGETTQSSDSAQNVVRVGDAITAQLEKAGFKVIHDTSVHDDEYTEAYANSGKTIDKILKKYPSVDVTIDVHRDSIGVDGDSKARTSAVNTVNGKKAAQVMIVTGCEEGYVKNFPNWYDNLHFALGLQKQIESEYSGLTRPVFFSERRYDMYKTKNSVLIEFGSDGNTLEQAVYSGKMVGEALANYLDKYVG